jgi:phage tail sheath gpL-like
MWTAAALTAAAAHIRDKSDPRPGSRSKCVAAFTGATSSAITLAVARNYHRLDLVNQPNSLHDVADLVGNKCAVLQRAFTKDPTENLNGYTGRDPEEGANPPMDWEIKGVKSVADWPDDDDANDAILGGVTLIRSNDGGSYISKYVTTQSKNAGGTVNDSRSRSGHIVSGADYAMDELLADLRGFSRKKLKADQRLDDGSVDANQKLAPKVVTPSTLAPTFLAWGQRMEDEGIFRSGEEVARSLLAQIDPENGSRVETGFDFSVIAHLDQITVRAAENTPG